jgi:geranylgeranyl pyrophosphate synthase
MSCPSDSIPLGAHRALLARYLQGIAFPTTSVAGEIIEERLSGGFTHDPVRPCLVLWACAAGDGDVTEALPVAAAFDLFDRFLLLHDEISRDSAAITARWGLGQSLNAGDALYALAFRLLASDVSDPKRRLTAARLVGEAVLEAIEGGSDDRARSAALTGAALEAGVVIAGAPERIARSFARAGRLLGTAGLARGSQLAEGFALQAVAELQRYTSRAHLDAFEEVVRYVARRAA